MSVLKRIKVSLPPELVKDLDRRANNRSQFVAEAVRKELNSRRREEFRRSLQNPHPESADFAEWGLEDWNNSIPVEAADEFLDNSLGKPVRWIPGVGWINVETSIKD